MKMDLKKKINTIILKAEKLQESEDYVGAYQEWDNVVTELNISIKTTKASRQGTKAIGWIVAFLTGGLGPTDAFLIPAINKGLLSLFKIDLDFVVGRLSYSLNQRQCCIYNSPDLLKITDYKQELTYFAFSYYVANNVETSSEKMKRLFSLFHPFEDSYDLRFHKSVPSLLDDIHDVISNGRITQEIRTLNMYLSKFLRTHNKINNSVYRQVSHLTN